MARILAVDYGGKRTGLAWTDRLQISINPFDTILSDSFELYIKNFLEEHTDVATVVFGMPTHADGTATHIGKKVMDIVAKAKVKYPSVSWEVIDESYTSKDARRMMVHLGIKKKQREKKENIDRMSAVLILKSYLDSI